MSLIEQLGGYEKAKKAYSDMREAINQVPSKHSLENKSQELKAALLIHRRANNIFEVGDKVVKTHPKNTILWSVLGVYKDGGVWLDYKGFNWKPPRVRHATSEEIAAGHRLD